METKFNLKEIDGYNGKYLISDCGMVFSKHKGYLTELKTYITHKGYVRVSLSKNSKNKHYRVHRLVAEYFKENMYSKLEVNHLDGNKTNNHVDNLVWSTWEENYHHSVLCIEKTIPKKGSELERYIQLKQKLFLSY